MSDLNGDTLEDFFVQDPCGSWFALGSGDGDFMTSTNSGFERTPVRLYSDAIEGASGDNVLLGDAASLTLVDLHGNQLNWLPLDGEPPRSPATHLFALSSGILDAQEVLVQRHGSLIIVPIVGGAAFDAGRAVTLEHLFQAPYVAPFTAFDVLTPVLIPGCSPKALGIGLFEPKAGRIIRSLQSISLQEVQSPTQDPISEKRQYTTAEIFLPGHVLTFAIALHPDSSGVGRVLGVIYQENEDTMFAILERQDCDRWNVVAEREIDFALKTPPAPAWVSPTRVPRTEHIVLLSRTSAAHRSVEFFHYDGYDLRVVTVRHENGWSIDQQVMRVHVDRSDLTLINGASSL